MQDHREIDEVIAHIYRVGDLEGAPTWVVRHATHMARTMLLPASPSMRVSPATARNICELYIRTEMKKPEFEEDI